jgi:hypothetical protein
VVVEVGSRQRRLGCFRPYLLPPLRPPPPTAPTGASPPELVPWARLEGALSAPVASATGGLPVRVAWIVESVAPR